jgi:ketosteroid isomerase-like protein
MSPKALLLSVFEAINEKKLIELTDFLADDAVFHFPKTAPIEGEKRIITFMKVLLRKYPDLTFTPGRLIANETMAAAEWTNRGQSKNGDPHENAGVTFLQSENGKIVYISDTFKNTDKF